MPRYKFPNGNEQDLPAETAALFSGLELVADEGYDEQVDRERRENALVRAELERDKVDLEEVDPDALPAGLDPNVHEPSPEELAAAAAAERQGDGEGAHSAPNGEDA